MTTAYMQEPDGHVFTTDNPEWHKSATRLTAKAGKVALRDQARAQLREVLPPGATAYTILRHVSRSGMMRRISVVAMRDGEPCDVTYLVSVATGIARNRDGDALAVGGCGMDMGFHVVYELSYALYGAGFGCTGERCPSNDHSNGDRGHTPHSEARTHWHASGGYALRHAWL